MVDELAQISVEGRNATFFCVGTVFGLVLSANHCLGKRLKAVLGFLVIVTKLCRRKSTEESPEISFKEERAAGKGETTDSSSVRSRSFTVHNLVSRSVVVMFVGHEAAISG